MVENKNNISNNSFFDSHYTGYSLSSNSQNIEFSLSENWFYVIFEGTTAVDNPVLMISQAATIGEEIIISPTFLKYSTLPKVAEHTIIYPFRVVA